jgi:hypothetical protein
MRENDEEEDASSSDDEEMRPGAVAVAGLFTGTTSTSVVEPEPEGFVVEAKLVDAEEDLTLEERQRIEAETRARVYDEIGQVAEAAIVSNDGKRIKYWICAGVGGVAILLAIILGVVLGVDERPPAQDTSTEDPATTISSPTVESSSNPTFVPTIIPTEGIPPCGALKNLNVGDSVSWTLPTSSPATVSVGDDDWLNSPYYEFETEKFVCSSAPPNTANAFLCIAYGVSYYFRGNGMPVRARVRGVAFDGECGSPLEVYEACDSCGGDFYPVQVNDTEFTAAWVAEVGMEYVIQVTGVEVTSGFDLDLVNNEECENAFGPITPEVNTIVPGTTLNGVSTPPDILVGCGTASISTAPSVWYAVIGNGKAITASTCGLASGFDTQIFVFVGSCSDLQCLDGNDDFCGKQSTVAWSSESGVIYFVLVQGAGSASGDFLLQLSTEGDAVVSGDVCGTALSLEIGDTREVPLSTVTEVDSIIKILCHPQFEGFLDPAGIWYKITGNGATLTANLFSEGVGDMGRFRIEILTGPSCSDLSCQNTCDNDYFGPCEWLSSQGEQFYVFVGYNTIDGRPTNSEVVTLTVT